MELKRVAYEPMNEIHDKEAEILEKLLEKLNSDEDYSKELEEFIKDVENHFSFEENLMEKYNFFAKIPHKMEHNRILNELYQLRNLTREEVKRYFDEYFLDWLDQHIATMDTVTAGFFNMVNAKA
ncbi:hemerythrin family protein [Caminibacter sp.]